MTRQNDKYNPQAKQPIDLEGNLIAYIVSTGREEIKRLRKKRLSAFFLKDGRIVEQKPDMTEVEVKLLDSKWITLEKQQRTISLK